MENKRHSGQVWCKLKRIIILEPKGWGSLDDFNHNLISYEEFLNRAAASNPKMEKAPSRREAARILKKL